MVKKYKSIAVMTPEQQAKHREHERLRNKKQRDRRKLGIHYAPSVKATPEEAEARRQRTNAKARVYANEVWNTRRAEMLLKGARIRAAKKGLEFNLTIEDIIIPDVCPVFGTSMDSSSIDRVDNKKGYTKDNVCVISRRANTLKHDNSIEDVQVRIEELKKIISYMESYPK